MLACPGRLLTTIVLLLGSLAVQAKPSAEEHWQCPASLNSELATLEAGTLQLCDTLRSAKAVVIVNTASLCGYTPQFKGLEALYQRFKDQGLLVLGVPTADFGNQEYLDSKRTAKVCHANFGVSFPVFHRGCIRCDSPHPLLALAQDSSGISPSWNFFKTVFDPQTGIGQTFPSAVTPLSEELVNAVTAILDQ